VTEIVRPLDDPLLNRFVDSTRRAGRVETLPKENAGPEMLRLLREGWLVGVLADQSPRNSAAPVTFFGQPCWGTIAPVMVALRARVPVHSMLMVRERDGRYRFVVGPALEFVRTGDLYADLIANCQRVQDEIERMVRLYPDQWLWIHRRWKARPTLEREWEDRSRRGKSASGNKRSNHE
jgi:KDO2-lipid IV(A) lauroyltransferase